MLYRLSDRDLTSLAYHGGKAKIAHMLARFRPWQSREYREPFVGGGAMFNYLRRQGVCERYWINDIDPRVATCHLVLRDDADALIERLGAIHDEHGGGTRALFDRWLEWQQSGDQLEVAASVFLRGLIVRGSKSIGYGFARTRVEQGKAITRSKIIRLRGFAEILQGVKITNVDYGEVMAAPGTDVFIYADPPYEQVGEDLYDHGAFTLAEFAAAVNCCKHNVLWTLNASGNTEGSFARHNVIRHTVRYSIGGKGCGDEIIGANYTNPLFEVYAREIGESLNRAA